MDGVDFINRLDDDSLHLIFDQFQTPTQFAPFGQVCRRWNGLMSLFCLQMTTLAVYDHEVEYGIKPQNPNVNYLLRIAASTPNVQNLRIDRPVVNITPAKADRLAQLWPRVQELDLEGSDFNGQVLGNFTRHFPLLKKLKIKTFFRTKTQLFDTIFLNHPYLVDFDVSFWEGADSDWFRSCNLPLERFAVNTLLNPDGTLDTLENCCKNSLQSFKIGLNIEISSQLIGQIFSTFKQLRNVSLNIHDHSILENQPVLPHLEVLCLTKLFGNYASLTNFFTSYPQLKEFHFFRYFANEELVESIATMLPNLRSLSFYNNRLPAASWMKLTALTKLESFASELIEGFVAEDVLAFVRQMPSLQQLTFWTAKDNSNSFQNHFSLLFKSIRDDIRSSGLNRRLWISGNHDLFFALDSSDECTDEAIEKFAKEMTKKRRHKLEHC